MKTELVNLVCVYMSGIEMNLYIAAIILRDLIWSGDNYFSEVTYTSNHTEEIISSSSLMDDCTGMKKHLGRQFKNQMHATIKDGGAVKLFSNGTFHFTGYPTKSLDKTMELMLITAQYIIQLVISDNPYYRADIEYLRINSSIYHLHTGLVVDGDTEAVMEQYLEWSDEFDKMQLTSFVTETTLKVYLYFNKTSSVLHCNCGLNYKCGIGKREGKREYDCKPITVIIHRTGLFSVYAMNSIDCVETVLSFIMNMMTPVMTKTLIEN